MNTKQQAEGVHLGLHSYDPCFHIWVKAGFQAFLPHYFAVHMYVEYAYDHCTGALVTGDWCTDKALKKWTSWPVFFLFFFFFQNIGPARTGPAGVAPAPLPKLNSKASSKINSCSNLSLGSTEQESSACRFHSSGAGTSRRCTISARVESSWDETLHVNVTLLSPQCCSTRHYRYGDFQKYTVLFWYKSTTMRMARRVANHETKC